jgi:hypothetical protein
MKKPAPIENLTAAQARREHARLGEEITVAILTRLRAKGVGYLNIT